MLDLYLGSLRRSAEKNVRILRETRRQRPGERRQKYLRLWVLSRQPRRAVERYHRFSSPGRSRHASRAVERSFHNRPLRRVKEDDPLIPGEIESLPQFLLIVDHAESALRIRVEERRHIRNALYRRGARHRVTGGQVQQPLDRLIGQMSDQRIEVVFGYQAYRIEPFRGNAEGKEIVGIKPGEQRRLHLLFNDLRI